MTEIQPHLSVRQDSLLGWIVFCGLVFAFLGIIGLWLIALYHSIEIIRQQLLAEHYVAIVGLPTSAIAAFMLVYLFRQTSGPIEIEAFSIKFKGAAGPVILWIFCFLAMATALKLTW